MSGSDCFCCQVVHAEGGSCSTLLRQPGWQEGAEDQRVAGPTHQVVPQYAGMSFRIAWLVVYEFGDVGNLKEVISYTTVPEFTSLSKLSRPVE